MVIRVVGLVGFLIVTTVSAWITAFQMRRKIKKSLGRNVSDTELVSINTWMKVEEAEQRNEQSKPINPR